MNAWAMLSGILGKKLNLGDCIPIVSFTFDDAPLSAFEIGGKILENYGFRGTYYVSAGLFGGQTAVGRMSDFDVVSEYNRRGHEIGNHTYDHIDCKNTKFMEIIQSVRRNCKRLKGIVSGDFAYPYGAVDARARVAAWLVARSARGVSQGINKGVIDLMDLKAVRVYSRLGIDACLDLASECAARGGWIIFYTHDVCREPSEYGCTPEQFTRLVQCVSERRIAVETVDKALNVVCSLGKRAET